MKHRKGQPDVPKMSIASLDRFPTSVTGNTLIRRPLIQVSHSRCPYWELGGAHQSSIQWSIGRRSLVTLEIVQASFRDLDDGLIDDILVGSA